MVLVNSLAINSSYLKYLPRIGSANRDIAFPCLGDSCNLLVGLMVVCCLALVVKLMVCFGGDVKPNPPLRTAPLSANRFPNCNSSHRLPPIILFSETNICSSMTMRAKFTSFGTAVVWLCNMNGSVPLSS